MGLIFAFLLSHLYTLGSATDGLLTLSSCVIMRNSGLSSDRLPEHTVGSCRLRVGVTLADPSFEFAMNRSHYLQLSKAHMAQKTCDGVWLDLMVVALRQRPRFADPPQTKTCKHRSKTTAASFKQTNCTSRSLQLWSRPGLLSWPGPIGVWPIAI